MLQKILPLVLLLIGAGAGVGAGVFLRPEPLPPSEMEAEIEEEESEEDVVEEFEYVKLSNQFVVPIVDDQQVRALVVMSLSVEVPIGGKDAIYSKEPKIRDSFLQVLFDHANTGGFEGEFTNTNNLDILRNALREVGQRDLGDVVSDVLIMEVARQDY